MAGDWIKMEKCTANKPEVLRMAGILEVHPDTALGLCFRFWCWCDDHLTDGHALGVTTVTLDIVIGRPGFAQALIDVGWLQVRNSSLVVPRFDRHLSDSAKNRALAKDRKTNQRRKHDSVTNVPQVSRSQRDKTVTREEKRREENINKKTNTRDTSEIQDNPDQQAIRRASKHWADNRFRQCWQRWLNHASFARGRPISLESEQSQLYSLEGFTTEDATQMIEFSIKCDAKNLITNGDHARTEDPRPRRGGRTPIGQLDLTI